MLVTALNAKIGYEKAADIAKTALAERRTLKDVAVNLRRYLSNDEFEKIVSPEVVLSGFPRLQRHLIDYIANLESCIKTPFFSDG
jgi:aspartate ammonia-lyase